MLDHDVEAVSGRVETAAGEPVQGAHVSVPGEGGGATTTDARGEFELRGVVPRSRTLLVRARDYGTTVLSEVSRPAVGLRIILSPSGSIHGRLRHEGARGSFRVRLSKVAPSFRVPAAFSEVWDSPDGSFRIEGLAPGSYELSLDAPDLEPTAGFPVEIRAGDATLVTIPGVPRSP